MSSGRFAANAAWLAVQVMAHNLARWAARIGLGKQSVTTKTLRRRFFSLAGRLTRKARLLTLHLPQGWPWENQFSSVLARLRALPGGVHPVHPHYPIACRIRARPASECPRRQPYLLISPAATTAGRQKSPWAGCYTLHPSQSIGTRAR